MEIRAKVEKEMQEAIASEENHNQMRMILNSNKSEMAECGKNVTAGGG